MLNLDPKQRLTMSDVMNSEWLDEDDPEHDAFVKEMRSRPIAESKDVLLRLTWIESDEEARKVIVAGIPTKTDGSRYRKSSTSFWSISRVFVSRPPPLSWRVISST